MPLVKIRIQNLDITLKAIQKGEKDLLERLKKGYNDAIEETAIEITAAAQGFLNKPNWELSKAIKASRLKYYDNRHIYFQAVETENNLNPPKNTPGAYAFYQENGYVVEASKVRRPRKDKFVTRNKKGRTKKAAYRKQEAKKFYAKAAEKVIPKLTQKIEDINNKTRLELKR